MLLSHNTNIKSILLPMLIRFLTIYIAGSSGGALKNEKLEIVVSAVADEVCIAYRASIRLHRSHSGNIKSSLKPILENALKELDAMMENTSFDDVEDMVKSRFRPVQGGDQRAEWVEEMINGIKAETVVMTTGSWVHEAELYVTCVTVWPHILCLICR